MMPVMNEHSLWRRELGVRRGRGGGGTLVACHGYDDENEEWAGSLTCLLALVRRERPIWDGRPGPASM